jgi:LmbE family N-acetylglucosaminyl deacetylase
MLNTSRVLKLLLALVCAGILINAPRSQQAAQTAPLNGATEDRVALYQALLDLTNPWTVMCIAAHPDDEDGTSLIVMRHKYGAHTVSLFSTFGEGGQNAIGPELYEELGAIRARETMAAAEIQGSEPHFLGLKDFGYSKSADEAFRVWGHDEALRRMVLQIRKLRPDVIITNHSVTNNDHGHHQATARLELEAFDAAADPKRFPEQLKELYVWQVKRLFVRAGRSNQAQANGAGVVSIDPNERDHIRNTVFAEEALRALQEHATQGPWPKTLADMARFRNAPDGKLPVILYLLVREAKDVNALPKDSHNFFDGLQLPEDLAKRLSSPTIDGQPLTDFVDQRDRVVNALRAARKDRSALKRTELTEVTKLGRMHALVDEALAAAAGLQISIAPKNPETVLGSSASLTVNVSNRGKLSPWLSPTHSDTGDFRKNMFVKLGNIRPYEILPGKTQTFTYSVLGAKVTVPHSDHLYDDSLFTEPTTLSVGGKIDDLDFQISTKTWIDVAPTVEIANITPSPFMLTLTKSVKPAIVNFQLINHSPEEIEVGVLAWTTWRKLTAQDCKTKLRPFEQRSVSCVIAGLETPVQMSNNVLLAQSQVEFALQDLKKPTPIGKKSLHVGLTGAVVVPDLKVGYIRGFDHSLPNALTALGVESKELNVEAVKLNDLQQYSAIIVDNRVYDSQPELIAANQRLLDYAKEGGTLIVFYHKSNEWNPDPRRNRPQLAPFPIILGDERVTDENAEVTFEDLGHPLLNVPNKLQRPDFIGWIQERGLYYPKEWDANYYALLSMADPDENQLKGGLLVADYGSGHYIYTSLVWYRQLRAGVPGAYRMLANMISYGKTKP